MSKIMDIPFAAVDRYLDPESNHPDLSCDLKREGASNGTRGAGHRWAGYNNATKPSTRPDKVFEWGIENHSTNGLQGEITQHLPAAYNLFSKDDDEEIVSLTADRVATAEAMSFGGTSAGMVHGLGMVSGIEVKAEKDELAGGNMLKTGDAMADSGRYGSGLARFLKQKKDAEPEPKIERNPYESLMA